MIKIGDNFKANRSSRCWELTEEYEDIRKSTKKGKWKKGDTYTATRMTWHANLRQCCNAILDLESGKAEGDASSLIFAINEARDMIVEALQGVEG